MPGTTTPEPQPVEQVSEAALPSPSSTLIWVVQGLPEGQVALTACATWPSRAAASTRRTAPPRYSARSNAGVRCALAERSAAATRATLAGARTPVSGGPAASTASAWAISAPPDDGGGFVTNVRSR